MLRDRRLKPLYMEAEYRAARQQAGLFDLSPRGHLEVLGPDRVAWLHNLLTNDVKALTPGRGCYAALLTPQGKVRADMAVLMCPDAVWLDYDAALTTTLPAALGQYKISERVDVRDRTSEFGLLSVQGPRAPAILSACGFPVDELAHPYDHRAHDLNGVPIRIIRWGLTGDPGYHCVVPTAHARTVRQQMLDVGRPFGLTPCGMDTWEGVRIEAGRPRTGVDFDETTLLPEAGLDEAVSRTKGCYVGQEFVVRIRDRGQITRRLCLLALDGPTPAARGDLIVVGEGERGVITSSAYIPTRGHAMALGLVRRGHWSPGMAVTVRTADGLIKATVIDKNSWIAQ